jgi:hypothetical protein
MSGDCPSAKALKSGANPAPFGIGANRRSLQVNADHDFHQKVSMTRISAHHMAEDTRELVGASFRGRRPAIKCQKKE